MNQILQLQWKHSTGLERYLELTAPLGYWLSRQRNQNFLSFGCSTGEEMVPLKLFAPRAKGLGVDIDEHVLARARKRVADLKGLSFANSTPDAIKSQGPYTVILANAVLCRHPDDGKLAQLFPFSRFEDLVGMLIENLAPGGALMVSGANYFVEDTASFAGQFTAIDTPMYRFNSGVTKYDKDGRAAVIFDSHDAVATPEGDDRDPFSRCRHLIFVKGDSKTRQVRLLKRLYRLPKFETLKRKWAQSITMRRPPAGWTAVPYLRVLEAVKVNESPRTLVRYSRYVDGKRRTIGAALISP